MINIWSGGEGGGKEAGKEAGNRSVGNFLAVLTAATAGLRGLSASPLLRRKEGRRKGRGGSTEDGEVAEGSAPFSGSEAASACSLGTIEEDDFERPLGRLEAVEELVVGDVDSVETRDDAAGKHAATGGWFAKNGADDGGGRAGILNDSEAETTGGEGDEVRERRRG